MTRKDAKGEKTQSLMNLLLSVFAPFASLREILVRFSFPRNQLASEILPNLLDA